MKKHYEAPALDSIGSVSDLTQANLNKVGLSTDAASQSIPGLNGSIIPD